MSEDNGFILKAEMYNQEEWYQMYLSILKVCKELQQENSQLKEIIEEVREYIWSHKYEWGDLEEDNEDFDIDGNDILEILYKVRRSK